MLKNREEYINALAKSPKASIFFQPWWLDAVCDNNWKVIFARDKGGQVIGYMPYWEIRKFGMPVIVQPNLTPRLGIQYIYPPNIIKEDAKLSFEKKVCFQIIKQIPGNVFYSQMFHTGFKNWLPFYWQGFQQTTHYTYILENINNDDAIFNNMKGSVRSDITKAKQSYTIKESNNINDYHQLAVKSFNWQGLKKHYSPDFIRRIDNSVCQNSKRLILTANEKDIIVASIYIVIGQRSSYLLGIGIDRKYKLKGVVQYLIWEGIKRSAKYVDTFDFEGSMKYSFEKVFRAFGSKQHPYFHIYKYKNRFFQLAHSYY